MREVLAFHRTRRNHNSFASLAGALVRAEPHMHERIAFVEKPRTWPAQTRIAAFSFATLELPAVAEETSRLRTELGERVVLVAGGPHPSADPRGSLKLGFDAVFVGEGEDTFPRFVREVAADMQPRGVFAADPQGIDLDAQPHAHAELGLFPFAEISRGCPVGCAFCQTSPLFHNRMRHRSPVVVAEGVRMAMQAGYGRIRFLSPDAFAYAGGGLQRGVEALKALLDAVGAAGARQIMLGNFPSEVRPERVTAELLALVKAHCVNRSIVVGAQSGSDRVLALMHRGHRTEHAREAVRRIHEAGFTPHVDILLGFPGEQAEERRATLDLARWCITRTDARIHAHAYLPLPGTAAWPARPEAIETEILEELRQLEAGGRLDGDWEEQIASGKKILQWREEGKILV